MEVSLKPEQLFEKERRSFMEIRRRLLNDPRYVNKYIAIVDGKVEDSDYDKVALVKRVYEKRGYIPMYIGKITREKRHIELPSPEKT